MDYNYAMTGDIGVSVIPFFNNGKELDKTCKHEELAASGYTVDGGIMIWYCKQCGAQFRVNFERTPTIKLKR